jgi:hypothetical protein
LLIISLVVLIGVLVTLILTVLLVVIVLIVTLVVCILLIVLLLLTCCGPFHIIVITPAVVVLGWLTLLLRILTGIDIVLI